jgi:polyhydroxybutyrate depolymerase
MPNLNFRPSSFSAAILMAMCAACGDALPLHPDWEGVGVLGEYIVHNGVKRSYALNLPTDYRDTEPTPLLLMFHGGGDTGPNFQRWSRMDSVADPAGVITVYPNATGYGCPDNVPVDECDDTPPFRWKTEDIIYVQELVGHLRHELTIDSTRIFAAGFSIGSLFTHELACNLADQLAGVAPISAPMDPQTAFGCAPILPIAILVVHGTADSSFPWNGDGPYLSVTSTFSGWAQMNGCVGEPDVEWLPDNEDDGTRVWTETYRDCDDDVEVLLYGIEGGGHTWPGHPGFPASSGLTSQDISVNEEIVDFISRHSRR